MKYCPLCDTEYRDSFERCTPCGVSLVPEELRGAPLTDKDRNDKLELLWRGGNPVAVGRVIEALRAAGIRHHVLSNHDNFVFELAMPLPKYEVRVLQSDAAAAAELVSGIEDPPFFGASSSQAEDEESALRPDALQDRRVRSPSEASVEVWSGEDAGLARILQDCFAENRIAVRRASGESHSIKLFVAPSDEQASREIVRQVIEGAPPGQI